MLWLILGIPEIAEKTIKEAKKVVRKPLVKAKPSKARSDNPPLWGVEGNRNPSLLNYYYGLC